MSRPLEYAILDEPSCPRCVALTRERDEAVRLAEGALLGTESRRGIWGDSDYLCAILAVLTGDGDRARTAAIADYERNALGAGEGSRPSSPVAPDGPAYIAALTRDLAQARQALKKATWDLACFTFKGKDISLGEEADALYAAFSSQPLAARGALVERGTEQTDTGVAQSAPSESSGGERL